MNEKNENEKKKHGTGELAQTLVLKMRSQVSRGKRVLPRWPIGRSRFVDFGGHFVFSLIGPYIFTVFSYLLSIFELFSGVFRTQLSNLPYVHLFLVILS